jgi:Tat protein secretion system quality control protein TatD with DNase activity
MYSAKYGGRSGRSKGKQATSKKKKHQKCSLCEEKGHDAADCPRVVGPVKNSGGAGSGRSHKTTARAAKGGNESATLTDNNNDADGSTLPLPPGFYNSLTALLQRDDDAPPLTDTATSTTTDYPVLFDAGCNVAEALDVIAQLKKSKSATSTTTYRQALAQQSALPYGGCLVRHMLKAGKSWNGQGAAIQWIKEADPHLYFVVGVGPTFGVSSKATDASDDEDSETDDEEANDVPTSREDDMEAAVDALTDALEDDETVVGVYGKLDYRPEVLSRGAGYDRAAQLVRFRATCRAARLAGVPMQCRVAPGASETTTTAEGEEDAYVSVVRDLAKVLVESSAANDKDKNEGDSGDLKIHLVSWNGTCAHMVKLLAAFPETLFVGLNASTGYTKATQLHACAFDVPLDRLLLETDAPQAIPAPVAAQSKTAFCHAGLIPWVAAAVAQHKAPTAVAVAAAATQNVVRLYGSAVIGARVEKVAAEFAAACEAARVEQQEQQESEDLLLEGQAEELATSVGNPAPAEVFESKQERKKKKKKKGQPNANVDTTAANADQEFDEEFLASLAVNDD